MTEAGVFFLEFGNSLLQGLRGKTIFQVELKAKLSEIPERGQWNFIPEDGRHVSREKPAEYPEHDLAEGCRFAYDLF